MALLKKLVLISCSLVALTSHAALFDDKEARKKILEVESTAKANNDAQQAMINDLKKRVAALEAVIQGQGLQDMQNQIEQLKQQVAQLSGDLEVANHSLELAQQREKDLYADMDTRLRKLETGSAPAAAAPTQAPAEEKDVKAFAEADNFSKSAKYKEAYAAYDAFLKDYPNSKLVPDALFGMGYAQFALKSYKSSIATQQKLIDGHSDSAKVPDAMYNMANSQIQLNQLSDAKKTLKSLVAKYPNADVTPNAQKRLKMLESIK
jgi:tol-pal system protein YbgF